MIKIDNGLYKISKCVYNESFIKLGSYHIGVLGDNTWTYWIYL